MELKKASVKVLDKIAVPLLLRCSLDLFKLFSVITFLSLISSRLLSTHKVFRCLFTCATFFRYLSFLTIIKCITLTFIKEYQLKKNFTTTRRHFTTTRRLSPLTVKIWFNLVVFKFLNGEFCRLYLCLVEVNWAPYHTVVCPLCRSTRLDSSNFSKQLKSLFLAKLESNVENDSTNILKPEADLGLLQLRRWSAFW